MRGSGSYLADLQMERQEHGAAIPCWERAIALSPKERPGPYISLGWSLQEEGRLSEAVEQYRTAVRLQPEAVMAQINLGGIHEELGEPAAAEAAYRTAARYPAEFRARLRQARDHVACQVAGCRPRRHGGAIGGSGDEPVDSRQVALRLGPRP